MLFICGRVAIIVKVSVVVGKCTNSGKFLLDHSKRFQFFKTKWLFLGTGRRKCCDYCQKTVILLHDIEPENHCDHWNVHACSPWVILHMAKRDSLIKHTSSGWLKVQNNTGFLRSLWIFYCSHSFLIATTIPGKVATSNFFTVLVFPTVWSIIEFFSHSDTKRLKFSFAVSASCLLPTSVAEGANSILYTSSTVLFL